MLSILGKGLQLLGLILLPLAMWLNLFGESFNQVSRMLIMTAFGFGIFYLGYIIRGYGENEPE